MPQLKQNEIKRIERTLDILESGFVKVAGKLFASLTPEIEPFISEILRSGNADNFELPGRKRYIALFRRYIAELFVQGMNLADKEIKARKKRFNFDVTGDPVIPEDALNWMDSWTSHFGDDYYGDLTNDVVGVLKQAIKEGASVPQTMDALGQYLSGPTFNKSRLEVIARTNATTAFNQGRLEMFRQNADFVPAVEYMAILDSRTTAICRDRDGKIFLIDDPALAANTPPLHYRCRSVLSPVVMPEWEMMHKEGWRDDQGNTLAELMDLRGIADPEKGFGNLKNALKIAGESGIIKPGGFNLQMFAAKDPEDQVKEYILRYERWKSGMAEEKDERIFNYSKENVDKALFYYKKNLKDGIDAPDGTLVNVTEKDFYKQITDPVILNNPELITEIIRNANVKILQFNKRYAYLSTKPAGYAVTRDILFSVHYLASKNDVEGFINNAIKKGGSIVWEKD